MADWIVRIVSFVAMAGGLKLSMGIVFRCLSWPSARYSPIHFVVISWLILISTLGRALVAVPCLLWTNEKLARVNEMGAAAQWFQNWLGRKCRPT